MAQFLNFLDMIDGGGAGATGNTFQGGGLLSDIANAVAKPRGFADRQAQMAQARPMGRPMAAPTAPAMPASPVAPQPMVQPQGGGQALKGQFYQAMQAAQLDPATVEANPEAYRILLIAFIRNGGRLPPLNNRPMNPVQKGF